jgi:hypothetical protein
MFRSKKKVGFKKDFIVFQKGTPYIAVRQGLFVATSVRMMAKDISW